MDNDAAPGAARAAVADPTDEFRTLLKQCKATDPLATQIITTIKQDIGIDT